jgi:hypothetical protein
MEAETAGMKARRFFRAWRTELCGFTMSVETRSGFCMQPAGKAYGTAGVKTVDVYLLAYTSHEPPAVNPSAVSGFNDSHRVDSATVYFIFVNANNSMEIPDERQ